MTDQAEAPQETGKKKTEVETVSMSDGRPVDFAGKRKLIKEVIIDGNAVGVRLDFRNGETRTFMVPDSLLLQAAGHGISQKLGDCTAGTPDVDDMVLDVDAQIANLEKGDWNVRREGSGMAGTSVLMQALMELSGKSKEEVKTFLADKTQAEKLALRMSAKVKPIVDRIEAEKATKSSKVNTEELLAGLDA